MKRILWLSSIATLAIFAPAFAADNVSVKDATGATVSTASKDVSGVHFRKDICVTLADTTIDCFTELNASLRAEDTASGDADSGLPIFAVRKATPANTSGTDGDYEALQISAGRLWTDAGALLPTSLGAKVGTGSLSVVPASDGFGVNATQTGTWNITNVSGTVSLPTGAATAAKQPALGTAGSSSADVITVQGIASGTNLNVNCQVGCSGGTAYTEDVAAAADPVGLAVISRRRDTLSASEVSADGDNIGLISTDKGELRINDNSLNTVIGTTADSAWASGSGSAISLLKTIATASLDTTAATVNLTQVGGNTLVTGNGVTGTGSPRVTIASDQTAFSVNLGTIGGAATAAKQPALGTAGTASSDVITVQGVASMTPIQTRSAGAATPVRIVSAGASTNLTEIADSGGCRIVSIAGAVARTSAVYLKLYNAADGSVTVGTTMPYITLPLPAGGTNPTSFQFDVNQVFASGACSLAMTTAVADNSTAALTAADVVGMTVIWGTN